MSFLKDTYPEAYRKIDELLDEDYNARSAGDVPPSIFRKIKNEILARDARREIKKFIKEMRLDFTPAHATYRLWLLWRKSLNRPGTNLSGRAFRNLVLKLHPGSRIEPGTDV